MASNAPLKEQVIRNCGGFRKGQFQLKDPAVRSYVKFRPDMIFDLLQQTSGPSRPRAKALLQEMSANRWWITATLHEGGKGGAGRAPDPHLHLTVRVKASHHLRCKAKASGALYIFDITR